MNMIKTDLERFIIKTADVILYRRHTSSAAESTRDFSEWSGRELFILKKSLSGLNIMGGSHAKVF